MFLIGRRLGDPATCVQAVHVLEHCIRRGDEPVLPTFRDAISIARTARLLYII